MSTGLLAPYEHRQYLQRTTGPYPLGKLWIYEAGTTTLATTWTTAAQSVENDNPLTLGTDGVCPPIYLAQDQCYRFELFDADGVLIDTREPVSFVPPLVETQDWVLNAVHTTEPTGTATYDLEAQSVSPDLYPSYWAWNGAFPLTLQGINAFIAIPDIWQSPLVFAVNASTTIAPSLTNQGITLGQKLYLRAGENTRWQFNQVLMLLEDNNSGIGNQNGWHMHPIYCPLAPAYTTVLTDGTVYKTGALDSIGPYPIWGQLAITVTQTDGGDPGGTIKVKADTANPPTTQRGFWNYGPGVAQQTNVIKVLTGQNFTITLTGATANRTVAAEWLGGPLTT